MLFLKINNFVNCSNIFIKLFLVKIALYNDREKIMIFHCHIARPASEKFFVLAEIPQSEIC